MHFTNLLSFEDRMKAVDVNVAFFQVPYGACLIEAVYSICQKKFMFAFVNINLGFTCSIKGDAYASAYINHQAAVAQLQTCGNRNRFDPKHFYDALNEQLPTIHFAQASAQNYTEISHVAISAFEDRIYFNHWRRANISSQQAEKTAELMGYQVVDFCRTNGVTPVFFDHPTQRTYESFENYIGDFNNHQFTY